MSSKRARENGQLSKESYHAQEDISAAQPARFPVASAGVMAARRVVSGRRLGHDAKALNTMFAEAVRQELEANPEADLTSVAMDYLSYADQLERRFGRRAGMVLACGNGDCGQLGFGTDEHGCMEEVKIPRLVPNMPQVSMVACGGLHNLACTREGHVLSWGSADEGCLGRDGPEATPAEVPGILPRTACQVAAGDCQSMVVCTDGAVLGWGTHRDKEGKGWFQAEEGVPARSAKHAQKTPVVIRGLPAGVAEVQCGASFNIALDRKGNVYSWGIGEAGELGRSVCAMKEKVQVRGPTGEMEEDEEYRFPQIVETHLTPGHMFWRPTGGGGEARVSGVKTLGCGNYHSLVVLLEGSRVLVCGLNNYGQLGLGNETSTTTMLNVEALEGRGILSVAGGTHHSLALGVCGAVFAWGRSDYGQLGVSTGSRGSAGDFINLPKEVNFPSSAGGPTRVTAVTAGNNHSMAITASRQLYTWGFGESHALGLGKDDKDQREPRLVTKGPAGLQVLAAAGGGQHTIIIGKVPAAGGGGG